MLGNFARTCVVTYSQKRAAKQASKAQGIYRTHARTHARWLNNNTLDCLFVCWLVAAEKRTTLRYQFPSLPLIITHFLSNSSFPTSIAATSSAVTTTTTTTTRKWWCFWLGKRQKPPQRQDQQLQGSSTQTKTIHTDTQREGKLQQRKETRDPTAHKSGPVKKTKSTNDSSHKTTTAKLLQQESSKQAHNPSEFFFSFFSKVIPESVVQIQHTQIPRESTGLGPREGGTEGRSERASEGGRAGGRAGRPTV